MAYKDLPLKERHAIIKAGVANGVHKLSEIESRYDDFVKRYEYGFDIDSFIRENPGAVFSTNPGEHLTDEYKLPNHPTFSTGSRYHSEATPGGRWSEDGKVYEPSDYVLNQQGGWNNFLRNFQGQEQGTGAVPVFRGGAMLPEVEVHPQTNGGYLAPTKSIPNTPQSVYFSSKNTSTYSSQVPVHRFEEGGPKYKQSSEAYYDPQSDTVFAPDSVGEFWHHERFHARPNAEYLQKIAPYYENLNDSVLTSFGADLSFVKRNGDPGQYYSPEEIGARVAASLEMLKKAGITSVSKDFITKSRKNENQYGDNYRDLLHMYNDDILLDLFNQYAKGGSIHIAPSKRGTFTAAATKHGKSVQAFASQVLANKENYSPAMVKKANFARNAAHWHADGGSNWLPDFTYNTSVQSDNGRQLVQSILQDEGIQRAVQQKVLQRQAEIEAQRKAVSEIYNGMPNPGAGYVSGTDPLLQAIVDMTPAGDVEMATEAASELKNGNLKEAGLLGAALLLPNIFNKGIKEWRAARALKNSESGLVYTTRNNLTKYNPNLNEETIQALQQAERDYNNGLFTLEHQSELDPIFELGLHTPAGKAAYPEGVEVWYRGLSKSKGKQVGITPEEFEEMWDKNVAAGNYSNLFLGDLNSARSYISGQTNPLEYARITGRNFPKGDDSKLLQLVFPKGRAVEIDANRAVWSDLSRIPFGKLSSKEEEMLKKASVAYDTEIKKRRLLQQRLDNYYKKHPEMLQSNSQSKWLQELQSKIDNSFYKVSDAHGKFMSLYKKKYPFSKTKDVSDYLTHSNFSGVTLHNIQDYGPALYLYGTPGSISIRKPVPGNYGKSAIASDFKFDLNAPSIWALGGNLKSTGGPMYPFSFSKQPLPAVRH